jgi:acid phosphatase (class A)
MKPKRDLTTATTALALAILFAVPAAAQEKESTETVAPPQVEEIKPGILAGYLDKSEHPDSLALLPPHPKPGTAAYCSDEAAAKATFSQRGSVRWQQAIKDANLHFPEAAEAFDTALGFKVTETDTPYLYQLMRRTVADAGLSTYGAKNVYKRERPFVSNGRPIGTPEEEAGLRKDGSYSSGHTAIGWAWALILCEVVPERTDAILKRGYEFGQEPGDLQRSLAERRRCRSPHGIHRRGTAARQSGIPGRSEESQGRGAATLR